MRQRAVFGQSMSVAAAIALAPVLLSAPAGAEAPGNPCSLALSLVCRILPIAPDLDEDIDLTQPTQQNPAGGAGSAPTPLPEH